MPAALRGIAKVASAESFVEVVGAGRVGLKVTFSLFLFLGTSFLGGEGNTGDILTRWALRSKEGERNLHASRKRGNVA